MVVGRGHAEDDARGVARWRAAGVAVASELTTWLDDLCNIATSLPAMCTTRRASELAQSSQNPLKCSGDNSVYFTVCMMFLWPR
jgi:hypothetical protein